MADRYSQDVRRQRSKLTLLGLFLAVLLLATLFRHQSIPAHSKIAPTAVQQASQLGGTIPCADAFRVPPEPSKQSFQRLQADPSLVDKEPALLAEFEAAPWLLPPRTQALPYAGVHNLDALLALRASSVAGSTLAGHEKVVALVQFDQKFAKMLQNCIYSMVKFGQVRNYVVLTWTPDDLEACAELNLPCADVAQHLPKPLSHGARAGEPGTDDYNSIVWMRPAVVLHCLQLGYTVMFTDADVVYANKPVQESFLALLEVNQADGTIQKEEPLNSGVFLALPTPGMKGVFQAHLDRMPTALKENRREQTMFGELIGRAMRVCTSQRMCAAMRANMTATGDSQALIRTFLPAQYMVVMHHCLNHGISDPREFPYIDPCDSSTLYVHAVCLPGSAYKKMALRGIGWWYLDDDKQGCAPHKSSSSGLPICRPRQWRKTDTEVHQYRCEPRPWLGMVPRQRGEAS